MSCTVRYSAVTDIDEGINKEGIMERAEVYALVQAALDAKAELTLAQERYDNLHSKLMNELYVKYALKPVDQK